MTEEKEYAFFIKRTLSVSHLTVRMVWWIIDINNWIDWANVPIWQSNSYLYNIVKEEKNQLFLTVNWLTIISYCQWKKICLLFRVEETLSERHFSYSFYRYIALTWGGGCQYISSVSCVCFANCASCNYKWFWFKF